jgi:hypothetical protein
VSPEQERVLYEVLEHGVETKTMVAGLVERLASHEAVDAKAHSRVESLEKHATRLAMLWGVLVFVVPLAWWFFGVLKGSAAAQ